MTFEELDGGCQRPHHLVPHVDHAPQENPVGRGVRMGDEGCGMRDAACWTASPGRIPSGEIWGFGFGGRGLFFGGRRGQRGSRLSEIAGEHRRR